MTWNPNHSGDCWYTRKKLNEHDLRFGTAANAFRDGLLNERLRARAACPECRAQNPENAGVGLKKKQRIIGMNQTIKARADGRAAHTLPKREHKQRARHGRADSYPYGGRRKKEMGNTATVTTKKTSAAQAFRDSLKLKTLKDDEAIVAYVRKQSGSKTFDLKTLAWYRSMHKGGKLAKKGRTAASSN